MASPSVTNSRGADGWRNCAERRLFAPGWPMLAGHGGTQNTYSAAGRQSALYAGAVSPHYLLSLGYEPRDAVSGVASSLCFRGCRA